MFNEIFGVASFIVTFILMVLMYRFLVSMV